MVAQSYRHHARKNGGQTDDDVTTPTVGPAFFTSDDKTTMPQSTLSGWTGGFPWESHWTSTLSTSTTSHLDSAYPEHTGYPSSSSHTTSALTSSSTTTGAVKEPYGSDKGIQPHPNRFGLLVAAGVVPIVVLAIIGWLIFFCLKKRRKQKQIYAAQAQVQEMKSRSPPQTASQPYLAAAPIPRPEPSYTAPPRQPPPASPTSPQPVILGPISGSNGNYMTGIDTSDIVSVRNEGTGLGDPFAMSNAPHEEPPPPYRPRSVAPLSRDTSLRMPLGRTPSSQSSLIADREQPRRSPFADPPDDDGVSDISGPGCRRTRDDLSAVSDLSYQQDPMVDRNGL